MLWLFTPSNGQWGLILTCTLTEKVLKTHSGIIHFSTTSLSPFNIRRIYDIDGHQRTDRYEWEFVNKTELAGEEH